MRDDGAVPVLNYYTQIEEYFWQKRGAHLLVSTLDWAVIETWQRAGIPLEVVLKGIDRAFERYDAKRRGRPIKSLLYCVDAVADAAEEAKEAAVGGAAPSERPAPFTTGEVPAYLRANAAALREAAERRRDSSEAAAVRDIATALEALAEQPATQSSQNLEDLERHLTVFEEKLLAALTQAASADDLIELRREVERGLAPYRRKMKPEQLTMIEKQFLQKKLFERYNLPRLSLFYLPVGSAAPPGEGA